MTAGPAPEPPERALAPARIAAVLAAASLPVFAREAIRRGNRRLFWTLLAAQQIKLGGAVVRYRIAYDVYDSAIDAERYHEAARGLARRFRAGSFQTGLRPLVGTNFAKFLTGVVYTVIGPSRLGAFLVFSWLGFWGLFLFDRAFALAVPQGRAGAYTRLVFFLPSLVYWPSAVGKDAWMQLSLGTGAFGGARALTGTSRRRLPLDALGILLAARMRPHVAAMLGASLATAYLVEGRRARGLFTAGFAGAVAFRANRYIQRWGIATDEGWTSALDQTSARTSRGGSAFTPPATRSPGWALLAAPTLLFRPHLGEAHNPQALASAAESALLLGLSVARVRWAAAAVRDRRTRPYAAGALTFTALFVAAYSGVANFGLLARQRAQALPFYLVLLSIPPPGSQRARRFARS